MFTSVSMRSAQIYKSVDMETSVSEASPHELIRLLFDALLQSLATARTAILNNDVQAKSRAITRSIRLIEEGLKAGLNVNQGGELAQNLASLYDYCVFTAVQANSRNDVTKIDEVISLLKPVADGWNQIKGEAIVRTYQS